MSGNSERKTKAARLLYPLNRLAVLIGRPGGATRDEAIAEATRRVEACRPPSMVALETLIATLEDAGKPDRIRTGTDLIAIRRTADRIISLALIFELGYLAEACKRLCDLLRCFIDRGEIEIGPIAVHLQAIRLLAPGGAVLPPEAAQTVLRELNKVLQHYAVPAGAEMPA